MRATILATMILAGCATPPPPTWAQMRADAAPLAQAKADCEFQAEANAGPQQGSLVGMVDRNLRRDNLMRLCMQAKGWQQQRG